MGIDIILKKTEHQDCDFCIDLWGNDEIGKYLSDPPKEYGKEIYESWKNDIDIYGGCHYFVAQDINSSKLIGTCSCVPNLKTDTWDIGYTIAKEYQKKGYGYRMIQLLIEFCKSNGAKFITASIAKENTPSNMLAKKLGFSVMGEGTFKKSKTTIVYEEYIYQKSI